MEEYKIYKFTCEKCNKEYEINKNTYYSRKKFHRPNYCKECMKKQANELRKNYYNNLSEEEKKVYAAKRSWQAIASPEKLQAYAEKQRQINLSHTDEERAKLNQKNSEGLKRYWQTV